MDPATCNKAGLTSLTTSPIFEWKMARRKHTCASDGCGRLPISTKVLQYRVLPMSWPIARDAIRLTIVSNCWGAPRILDLQAFGYPNYGASPEQYPIDIGRLRRVTEIVAEKSGWGNRKLGAGSGMGIAIHRSFLTYVATVVEVQINDSGDITIPRVDTAVDAGLVVNPEAMRAQFEGAAVFGTSIARSGEITAKNGAIEQSNFNDYPVARINEAPQQTNVYIVESDAPPAGVGEPGVPPFAPALCNAIFAATAKRVRELPLNKVNLGKNM